MRRRTRFYAICLLLGLPSIAMAQDARAILETALQKQLERWDGVLMYVVDQSIHGNRARTFMQRTVVEDDAGNTRTLFLPVSNADLAAGRCEGTRQMSAEDWEMYAQGMEMTGDAMAAEIEAGMEQAGVPPGLLSVGGGTPGTSMDPRVMMGSNARFARAMADTKRQQAGNAERDAQDARDTTNHMAQFIATAKLIGNESIGGREAYHLHAADINHVQQADGQEYAMQSISLWIDVNEHVPLLMKVDGVMKADGESRPMTIENTQADYRLVPGSKMYEPFRRIMKISGMMTAEQEAEMRDAQAQIGEFEKEMANMPPSQRAMVENMIGPQLEMMRNMASGDGFQSEIVVRSITVNPPISDGSPCL